ncbi:MAG: Hsp20/alpha crystallin family protein [Deltaproteobacteria bacterium]|nr:Hsp20/alpha crystallin family protein [Deltaproteobacteria bacterium]
MAYSREPWDFMNEFHEEFNRLFRSFVKRTQGLGVMGEACLVPRVDVFEQKGKLVVEIEVPGLRPEEIKITASRDFIVVEGEKGKRERSPAEGKTNYLCMERDFGRFRRAIELPIPGNTSEIVAELKGGVLRLVMPKVEERRGTKRTINIEYQDKEE